MKGKVIIDKERCKGCGLCISVCPKKILSLSKDRNKKGFHYAVTKKEGCTGCASCATICPDVVIEVYQWK